MITLYIVPNFNFKRKITEAGDYMIFLPYNGQLLPLWRMWCSSLRWAIQDCYEDFETELQAMFGEQEEIAFEFTAAAEPLGINEAVDLKRVIAARPQFKMPSWEDREDIYQKWLINNLK